jgi:hypothetical protein
MSLASPFNFKIYLIFTKEVCIFAMGLRVSRSMSVVMTKSVVVGAAHAHQNRINQ